VHVPEKFRALGGLCGAVALVEFFPFEQPGGISPLPGGDLRLVMRACMALLVEHAVELALRRFDDVSRPKECS
jgi:hypothetical protein